MLRAAREGGPAVVIGGGLLGLEAAAGLAARGMKVTVLHAVGWPMERQLDTEAGALLADRLRGRGLKLVMRAATAAFEGNGPRRGGAARGRHPHPGAAGGDGGRRAAERRPRPRLRPRRRARRRGGRLHADQRPARAGDRRVRGGGRPDRRPGRAGAGACGGRGGDRRGRGRVLDGARGLRGAQGHRRGRVVGGRGRAGGRRRGDPARRRHLPRPVVARRAGWSARCSTATWRRAPFTYD